MIKLIDMTCPRCGSTMMPDVEKGLDEYLKVLNNIPKEVLELIPAKAESVLELNLDGC